MNEAVRVQLAGLSISNEEWLVIAVVIVALASFELGPKFLNFIKNRRARKSIQKN